MPLVFDPVKTHSWARNLQLTESDQSCWQEFARKRLGLSDSDFMSFVKQCQPEGLIRWVSSIAVDCLDLNGVKFLDTYRTSLEALLLDCLAPDQVDTLVTCLLNILPRCKQQFFSRLAPEDIAVMLLYKLAIDYDHNATTVALARQSANTLMAEQKSVLLDLAYKSFARYPQYMANNLLDVLCYWKALQRALFKKGCSTYLFNLTKAFIGSVSELNAAREKVALFRVGQALVCGLLNAPREKHSAIIRELVGLSNADTSDNRALELAPLIRLLSNDHEERKKTMPFLRTLLSRFNYHYDPILVAEDYTEQNAQALANNFDQLSQHLNHLEHEFNVEVTVITRFFRTARERQAVSAEILHLITADQWNNILLEGERSSEGAYLLGQPLQEYLPAIDERGFRALIQKMHDLTTTRNTDKQQFWKLTQQVSRAIFWHMKPRSLVAIGVGIRAILFPENIAWSGQLHRKTQPMLFDLATVLFCRLLKDCSIGEIDSALSCIDWSGLDFNLSHQVITAVAKCAFLDFETVISNFARYTHLFEKMGEKKENLPRILLETFSSAPNFLFFSPNQYLSNYLIIEGVRSLTSGVIDDKVLQLYRTLDIDINTRLAALNGSLSLSVSLGRRQVQTDPCYLTSDDIDVLKRSVANFVTTHTRQIFSDISMRNVVSGLLRFVIYICVTHARSVLFAFRSGNKNINRFLGLALFKEIFAHFEIYTPDLVKKWSKILAKSLLSPIQENLNDAQIQEAIDCAPLKLYFLEYATKRSVSIKAWLKNIVINALSIVVDDIKSMNPDDQGAYACLLSQCCHVLRYLEDISHLRELSESKKEFNSLALTTLDKLVRHDGPGVTLCTYLAAYCAVFNDRDMLRKAFERLEHEKFHCLVYSTAFKVKLLKLQKIVSEDELRQAVCENHPIMAMQTQPPCTLNDLVMSGVVTAKSVLQVAQKILQRVEFIPAYYQKVDNMMRQILLVFPKPRHAEESQFRAALLKACCQAVEKNDFGLFTSPHVRLFLQSRRKVSFLAWMYESSGWLGGYESTLSKRIAEQPLEANLLLSIMFGDDYRASNIIQQKLLFNHLCFPPTDYQFFRTYLHNPSSAIAVRDKPLLPHSKSFWAFVDEFVAEKSSDHEMMTAIISCIEFQYNCQFDERPDLPPISEEQYQQFMGMQSQFDQALSENGEVPALQRGTCLCLLSNVAIVAKDESTATQERRRVFAVALRLLQHLTGSGSPHQQALVAHQLSILSGQCPVERHNVFTQLLSWVEQPQSLAPLSIAPQDSVQTTQEKIHQLFKQHLGSVIRAIVSNKETRLTVGNKLILAYQSLEKDFGHQRYEEAAMGQFKLEGHLVNFLTCLITNWYAIDDPALPWMFNAVGRERFYRERKDRFEALKRETAAVLDGQLQSMLAVELPRLVDEQPLRHGLALALNTLKPYLGEQSGSQLQYLVRYPQIVSTLNNYYEESYNMQIYLGEKRFINRIMNRIKCACPELVPRILSETLVSLHTEVEHNIVAYNQRGIGFNQLIDFAQGLDSELFRCNAAQVANIIFVLNQDGLPVQLRFSAWLYLMYASKLIEHDSRFDVFKLPGSAVPLFKQYKVNLHETVEALSHGVVDEDPSATGEPPAKRVHY